MRRRGSEAIRKARREAFANLYGVTPMLERVAIGEREDELAWRVRVEPSQIKRIGRLCGP